MGARDPECVCVSLFCKHTHSHTLISGYMPSTHCEHRNEINTLTQVIEQPPTHTESYLHLASCLLCDCWFFPWYWMLMHFFFQQTHMLLAINKLYETCDYFITWYMAFYSLFLSILHLFTFLSTIINVYAVHCRQCFWADACVKCTDKRQLFLPMYH